MLNPADRAARQPNRDGGIGWHIGRTANGSRCGWGSPNGWESAAWAIGSLLEIGAAVTWPTAEAKAPIKLASLWQTRQLLFLAKHRPPPG